MQGNNLKTSLILVLQKRKSYGIEGNNKFSPTRDSLVGLKWRYRRKTDSIEKSARDQRQINTVRATWLSCHLITTW